MLLFNQNLVPDYIYPNEFIQQIPKLVGKVCRNEPITVKERTQLRTFVNHALTDIIISFQKYCEMNDEYLGKVTSDMGRGNEYGSPLAEFLKNKIHEYPFVTDLLGNSIDRKNVTTSDGLTWHYTTGDEAETQETIIYKIITPNSNKKENNKKENNKKENNKKENNKKENNKKEKPRLYI